MHIYVFHLQKDGRDFMATYEILGESRCKERVSCLHAHAVFISFPPSALTSKEKEHDEADAMGSTFIRHGPGIRCRVFIA